MWGEICYTAIDHWSSESGTESTLLHKGEEKASLRHLIHGWGEGGIEEGHLSGAGGWGKLSQAKSIPDDPRTIKRPECEWSR